MKARRTVNPSAYRIGYNLGGLPEPFRDIQETTHQANWGMRVPHQHAFYQIVYVESGTAEIDQLPGARLRPGQCVVLPPGLGHIWRNTGGKNLLMLNIHVVEGAPGFAELGKYLRLACDGNARAFRFNDRRRFMPVIGRIRAEVRSGQLGYKYRIGAWLTEFLVRLVREVLAGTQALRGLPANGLTRVEKALWYIETQYAGPLVLNDIANVLGVSAKHACEVFRREIGLSPVQYLLRVRIEKAKLLMEDPQARIHEIAQRVGIEDEHYFSRLFKKITRQTPRQFRAAGREALPAKG